MARTRKSAPGSTQITPLFKTVDQMSEISGIGICKLRELIQTQEIEYIKIGTRYLLTEQAVLDWYQRNCTRPKLADAKEAM